MEDLQSELREAEKECKALPKEIQEIKTALDRETAELQRQESGWPSPFIYKTNGQIVGNWKEPSTWLCIHFNGMAYAALADKESLREGKLRSLRQALDLYRARLGLQFRKGSFAA